jgi:hypothetical protein
MLITPLFVRSSFLLKVIVLSTMTLSKNDEWTQNRVINIDGQHNNLKKKRRTDKQWGKQHWWTTQ